MAKTIDQLKEQTAQYAIEHITGKGMHTGIAWFRDSFNELCEAMHANEFNPDDLSFEIEDLAENLKKEPWVVVTTKHVADVLKVADTLSHRHLVGQKVAIDCIHALDKEQLQRLDCVLRDLEMNPNLGQSNGVGR